MKTRWVVVLALLMLGACDSSTSNKDPELDANNPPLDGVQQDQTVQNDIAGEPDSKCGQDTCGVDSVGSDIPVPQDLTPEDQTPPQDTFVPDVQDVVPDQGSDVADTAQPDLVPADETPEPDEVCVPDCSGKACGPDGCDGVCGECAQDLACDPQTWTCVAAQQPVATFINYLYLPFGSNEEPCCFDFNGDATIDNSAGSLVSLLGSFAPDIDVNQLLADSVESGQLAIVLEFVGAADWVNAAGFVMNAFLATDSDGDYSDNLNPQTGGDFLILPDSVDENDNPLIVFQQMSIEAGTLRGGPSKFVLDIPLLMGTPMTLVLDEAMIEGEVTVVGDKLWIEEGKLGGAVRKSVIIAGLNAFVESSCSCLGLSKPLIDPETEKCATGGNSAACDEPCASLNSYCSMATMLFGSILDVDLDQDGLVDSMSVGLMFQSIPARIVGMGYEIF